MNNKKNQEEKSGWLLIFLNKYYKYLIILLSLIIILTATFLWLKPKYLEVKNLTAQKLPFRERKLAELNNYYQELTKLSGNLTTFRENKAEEMKKLEKILPAKAGLPNLFAQLEALIESDQDNEYAVDFVINSINFTEPTNPLSQTTPLQAPSQGENDELLRSDAASGEQGLRPILPIIAESLQKGENNEPIIGTIEINLNLQGGGYFDFKKLLSNIEKHLRIMDITSIKFNDINVDEGGGETVNYDLTLRTYFFP